MFFSDFSFLLQLVSLSYPRQVFFFPCQQSCKMYWRRSFMLFLYCFFNVWPSPFILDSSLFFFNLLIHRSSWEVIDCNHLFKHPPSNFVHFLYCRFLFHPFLLTLFKISFLSLFRFNLFHPITP